MSTSPLPLLLIALALPARAQLQEGDVLLTLHSPGSQRHYRPDGTIVAQSPPIAYHQFEGAAVTAEGNWVTAYWTQPSGVVVFDPTGQVLLDNFQTPELFVAGDIALFADGAIAIVDPYAEEVEIYSRQGIHLSTVSLPPGPDNPWGIAIDARDEMWICEMFGQRVLHYARSGQLLGAITPTGRLADVDIAPDGTLWTIDFDNGMVEHWARDGSPLGSFASGHGYESAGVGVAPDGTIWTTSLSTFELRHHDAAGNLLAAFPVPLGAAPLQLTVRKTSLGESYCSPAAPNSTGAPGRIRAQGSPLVASDDVTLVAEDLPPAQFGYFLVGNGTMPFVPMASAGPICLVCSGPGCSGIGRYNVPGTLIQGPTGQLTIDLGALPLFPTHAVQPGETWNFQCWYRDAGTSNFTNAVAIPFH